MVIDQSRITKANVDNLFKAGKITQAQVDTFNKPIINPADTVTPMPNVVVTPPVLDMTNPKYKALIEKGNTPEEIAKAWEGIQKKQAKTATVNSYVDNADGTSTNTLSDGTTSTVNLKKDNDGTYTATEISQGEPSYTDISDQRHNEINTNLEAAFAANPNKFNNFDTFKSEYNFDKRNAQQQIWLKNRYDSKKDAIATNSANQVKLNSLTNLNDASLANISSADAVFLMNNDPTAYLRYQKAKTDKDNLAIVNSQTPEPEEDPYSLASIMKSFGIDMGTAEAISTETAEPRKELDSAKTEYDTAKRAYDNILADTQKQYQGETSSFVNAMAAKKQRELLPDLQTKLDAYNTKVASYNNVLEERKVAAAEKSQKLQDFSNAFAIYKANYEMLGGKDDANLAKTWTDPITGMGYQWNSQTNRYDIPIGNEGVSTTTPTSSNIDNTAYIDVPRTGTNVGADTNNFGNITSPTSNSIGMYKSPNGRSYAVYATAEDGYNALINDLKAKQTGNTKTGLNGNSTAQELFKTRVGSGVTQDYINRAVSAAGLKTTDKIGDISTDKLATAIMAGEGTLKAYQSGGKNLSGLGTPKTPSETPPTNKPVNKILEGYFDKAGNNLLGVKDLVNISKNTKMPLPMVQDEYGKYMSREILQSPDFQTSLESLSPLARSVILGGKLPVGKDQTKVLNEIAESGIANFGLGNSTYWSMKPVDRAGLGGLKNIQEQVNIIKALKSGTTTGLGKEALERLKNKGESLGINIKTDEDYNKLKMAAGKNLVSFMKEISGVAISEPERQRLIQLMPDAATMGKTRFNNAVDAFEREFNNIMKSKLTTYGFDDLNLLTTTLGLGNVLSGTELTGVGDTYDEYNR